jgi:predicted nucleotidyltransferase
MISKDTLNQVVSKLARATRPCKIILFGSYARNEATPDSDLDLLVIIKSQSVNKAKEMARLRHLVGHVGIGVDILVYSQQEVEKRGHIPSSALYYALKEGKILYDIQQTSHSRIIASRSTTFSSFS